MSVYRCIAAQAVAATLLLAQDTPEALARRVLDRFESGSPREFEALVPVAEAVSVVADARLKRLALRPGLARVLRQDTADTATLLLSGHLVGIGNSGDETVLSSPFSGAYEAARSGGAWRIAKAIPIESSGRIQNHRLNVKVFPGDRIEAAARLRLARVAAYGLILRLNHAARIAGVTWNGRSAEYAFGSGLLWIRAQGEGELEIRYAITVEHEPSNSGAFLPHAGHVRDQYLWQPYFGLNSESDLGEMAVTVRIPAAFQVATTLPQTGRIEGEERVVEARSAYPANSLALFYDRDWEVRREKIGDLLLEVFTTADFEPAPAKTIEEFRWTHGLLSARFGAFESRYAAIIQARARGDTGWKHLTNQGLVAGKNGAEFLRGLPYPSASFTHEVAHLWTRGAGGGGNLIREGWAAFCESLAIRERLGAAAERPFWDTWAAVYFAAADGKARLDHDPLNDGVAYSKGSWVFRMLEQRMGAERFGATMTRFAAASRRRPATVEDLLEMTGERAFLEPWIRGTRAPDLRARAEGTSVIVEQSADKFDLDVDVRVEAGGERIDRRVRVREPVTTIDFGLPVRSFELDPDRRLLLRREATR